jgi:hypothetical protein
MDKQAIESFEAGFCIDSLSEKLLTVDFKYR